MTQEEKRIKIAERCGWEIAHKVGKPGSMMCGCTKEDETPRQIPDYFSDLNACHEMIKSANFEDDTFLENLATIVSGKKCFKVSEANPWNFVEASAEQIAEAFGQTLKLW